MTHTVLITAPYFVPVVDAYRERLNALGVDVIVADVTERLEEDDLMRYAGRVDGVICGDDRFTSSVMHAFAPRLKVLSKWGTGIDSLDRETADRLGVRICNTPNAFTEPVADTTLGYILAFARRIPWTTAEMRAGEWVKRPTVALRERTLGIVGVGNIGRAVARRAAAFGMPILGCDIVPIPAAVSEETGLQATDLLTLLSASDFVTLHCDLNPTSRNIMNAGTFRKMRAGAVLINTARGPLVDESALVDALKTGRLFGAALDVFEHEPLPADSFLRKHEQVLMAPHNSNSSPEAWSRVHESTLRNLLNALGITMPATMRLTVTDS